MSPMRMYPSCNHKSCDISSWHAHRTGIHTGSGRIIVSTAILNSAMDICSGISPAAVHAQPQAAVPTVPLQGARRRVSCSPPSATSTGTSASSRDRGAGFDQKSCEDSCDESMEESGSVRNQCEPSGGKSAKRDCCLPCATMASFSCASRDQSTSTCVEISPNPRG